MAKPNTSSTQSVGGVLKSFLPGGQKANWAGLGRSTVNVAGEATGVYDIGRGVKNIAQSGILPGGKKADWGQFAKGVGQTAMGAVGAIPVVGVAGRGAVTALRAANVLSDASKGGKFISAATKAERAVLTPLIKPKAITPATTTAGRVAQAVTRNLPSKLSSPFILATAVAPAVAGLGAGIKAGMAAPTPKRSPYGTPTGPLQGPGLGGRDQNLGTTSAGTTGGTTGGYTSPYAPTETVAGAGAPGAAGAGTAPEAGTTPTYGGGAGAGVVPENFGPMQGFATSGDVTGTTFETGGGTQATGGASPVGVPGGVQVAGADYLASLAANAAQSYGRQAGFREALAQGIEGVQGSAADIIGGRSQAILGQGLTGQRRSYQTRMAGEVQRQISDQEASRNAYNAAMSQAYSQQAQAILDAARARSEQAAQIRRIG